MADKTCTINGCTRRVKARGLCNPHYARQYRGADVSTPIREALAPTCTVKGCVLPSHGRGLCSTHYAAGIPTTRVTEFSTRR